MTPHPVIQTSPYYAMFPAVDLKSLSGIMFQLIHKGLVMPVIVILLHRCNFFCKITAMSIVGQCVIAETDTFECVCLIRKHISELI